MKKEIIGQSKFLLVTSMPDEGLMYGWVPTRVEPVVKLHVQKGGRRTRYNIIAALD